MFMIKIFQIVERFIKPQAGDGRVQRPDFCDAQRTGLGRYLRLIAAQRLPMIVA